MSEPDVPADWTPLNHRYVDGEWVMTWSTPDGQVVDATGDPARLSEFTPERYVQTAIVDGERHLQRVDGETGAASWYDGDGNDVGMIDPSRFDTHDGPGTLHVHDGQLYREYPDPVAGTSRVMHADGSDASISPAELATGPELPDFVSFAEVGGRRAIIGTDADGDQQLYTIQGRLIDGPVDWSQVARIDPGALGSDPISIGEYRMNDGRVEDVYLFPGGSQAVRSEDGSYERVLVLTDAEYPSGHAFFEGAFPATDGGQIEVFSYPDGTTAVRDADGELVLLDVDIDLTHPGDAPVSCGPFPGGDLFVFPDGTQLIHRDDGTWAPGSLPGIDPYETLVDRYGDPEPASLDDALADGSRLLEDAAHIGELFDDITGVTPPRPLIENVTDDGSGDGGGVDDDATPPPPAPAPVSDAAFSPATPIIDPLPQIDLDQSDLGAAELDATDPIGNTDDPVDDIDAGL